jgi:hypothetical protein
MFGVAIFREVFFEALDGRAQYEGLGITHIVDGLADFSADVEILMRQVQELHLHGQE